MGIFPIPLCQIQGSMKMVQKCKNAIWWNLDIIPTLGEGRWGPQLGKNICRILWTSFDILLLEFSSDDCQAGTILGYRFCNVTLKTKVWQISAAKNLQSIHCELKFSLHCGKTVLCSVQKGIYKASIAQRWMAELQEWKEILHPGILHSRHQLGRSTHSSDPWEIALFIGHSSPCNFGKVREVLGNLGTTNTLSFSLIHQYVLVHNIYCDMYFSPFNCHLFFFKIQYTLFLWIWYFLYALPKGVSSHSSGLAHLFDFLLPQRSFALLHLFLCSICCLLPILLHPLPVRNERILAPFMLQLQAILGDVKGNI